ncbi:VOC family protein [Luteolibacter sp. AS25]|uniref:VOC family protein n=1 Tax=Luteolibacter sp. AS25 TaxID=3135776 RepID=UPI00398ACD57
MPARLNLTVIRSGNIEASADFYRLLGLEFEKHSHGNGPMHYAASSENSVFEIYPATVKFPPTVGTRIGFEVDHCDSTVALLAAAEHSILSRPADSPWGRRAVAVDPDGHKVELVSHDDNEEAEQGGGADAEPAV